MGWLVDRLAPELGLDASTASIADVQAAIQRRVETDYGPLNRTTSQPWRADFVIELTGEGWALMP